MKNEKTDRRRQRGFRGSAEEASRPEQTRVHFQSFQAFQLMAPTNERPHTLHSAPLWGEDISGWEVSECDTWPHKRPRLAEECRRRFHACDARGLAAETSISDRFSINAAIFVFVWRQRSPRGLSDICVSCPPLLPPLFVAFVGKTEKKRQQK